MSLSNGFPITSGVIEGACDVTLRKVLKYCSTMMPLGYGGYFPDIIVIVPVWLWLMPEVGKL